MLRVSITVDAQMTLIWNIFSKATENTMSMSESCSLYTASRSPMDFWCSADVNETYQIEDEQRTQYCKSNKLPQKYHCLHHSGASVPWAAYAPPLPYNPKRGMQVCPLQILCTQSFHPCSLLLSRLFKHHELVYEQDRAQSTWHKICK